jgi:formate--tetrahydrofolate ligase
MKEWQIAEAAEENLPGPDEWQIKLGLKKDEMIPYGKTPKLDFMKIIERLKNHPNGKYIEVTAITPTPLADHECKRHGGWRRQCPFNSNDCLLHGTDRRY